MKPNFVKIIKKTRFYPFLILFFFGGILLGYSQNTSVEKAEKEIDEIGEYKSAADTINKNKKGNFVPIPYFITDENLGYGGVLGVAYMYDNKKSNRSNTPQTITGIAGGWTSTGSWLVSAFHSQSLNNDKMRYDGNIGYADLFLDFYVLKEIDLINFPIQTNIKFWGMQHQMLFRIGNSKFFLGPQYRYMNLKGSIKLESDHPHFEDLVVHKNFEETVSALALLGKYDSRDDVLSPVTGYYTGFFLRHNANWLGATIDYFWSEIYGYAYYKVGKRLYTILKFNLQYASEETPFYAKPYVGLRGAPALKYQGNIVSTFENQWRIDLFKSISMVAFTGIGKAYNSFNQFDESKWVYNYGTGVRYTLKKVNDLRIGVDFGWAKEDFAWGISLGTGL